MIWDWLLREGWMLASWWLLVTLAGMAGLPFCLRLLHALPDKGFTLARVVGLLLVAWVYWLMASFGFIRNSTSGMMLAWMIVIITGFVFYLGGTRVEWRTYWKHNRSAVVIAEILFIVLLVGLAVYRAHQNDTGSTEKPMELTFISGIMRSETFPPNDPWMAGYSISYYHFGYIMSAMLSMLSGVSSGYGFSLTIAMWVALIGLTVFGVVYNLVKAHAGESRSLSPITTGLLAMAFVLIVGNLQASLIEVPYRARSMPASYFDFWGTQERIGFGDTPQLPFQLAPIGSISTPFTSPQEWMVGGWWWFRASRVLNDFNLDGTVATHAQPIDEFPAFSFILGDVHPHVLALPFVALAIGLALQVALSASAPSWQQIIFYGIAIGGLVFLNTWDAPIYLATLVGADAVRRLHRQGRLDLGDLGQLALLGLAITGVALVGYVPFLIGFRSQASGFLPNLIFPTQWQHIFLMFGTLLVPVCAFLVLETLQARHERIWNWRLGLSFAGILLLVLVGLMLLFSLLGLFIPTLNQGIQGFIDRQGGWDVVLPLLVQRRIEYAPTALFFLFGLMLVVARLFPTHRADHSASQELAYQPSAGFVLLLVGVGFSLVLIPEFIYLRDNFSTKINTIFKFYYQAWITLSIVAAYGIYAFLWQKRERTIHPVVKAGFGLVTGILMVMGISYTVFAVYTRAWLETGLSNREVSLTLDGTSRMPLSITDYQAIQCLDDAVQGGSVVAVEAVEMAYRSYYGRVASITGIPIVLGWENHEGQWRGSTYPETVGTRRQDIDDLYTDLRWDRAVEIINRYGIDYIIYGDTERQQYGSTGEEKFIENLSVVCSAGSTQIYRAGENLVPVTE